MVILTPRKEGVVLASKAKKETNLLSTAKLWEEAEKEGVVYDLVLFDNHGGADCDLPSEE